MIIILSPGIFPAFIYFPFLSFSFLYFFLIYTRTLFFKNKPWFYNWHCCLMSDKWNHLNFESPLTRVHWNQCSNKDIFISPHGSLASQCKLVKVRARLFWFGALLPQKDEKAQVQTSLLHNSFSKQGTRRESTFVLTHMLTGHVGQDLQTSSHILPKWNRDYECTAKVMSQGRR